MQMMRVLSSNVHAIGYDEQEKVLHVQFQQGPKIYAYADVSKEEHQALMDAESKGRHLNKHIKPVKKLLTEVEIAKKKGDSPAVSI